MIDPGHFGDMIDVVDQHGERCFPGAVRQVPPIHLGVRALRVIGELAGEFFIHRAGAQGQFGFARVEETVVEVDHHDSAVFGQSPEHVIAHVTRVIGQRAS